MTHPLTRDPRAASPFAWAGSQLRSLLKLCALACIAAVVIVTTVALPPASAHTQLMSSTPPDGSLLKSRPAAIRLVFTGELVPRFSTVALSVNDGPAQVLHSEIVNSALIADTEQSEIGRWKLTYRVTAQDGHPLFGSMSLNVDPTNPDAKTPPTLSPLATPTASDPGATAPGNDKTTNAGRSVALKLIIATAVVLIVAVPTISRLRTKKR